MCNNPMVLTSLEQPKHHGSFVSYCHRHRVARHTSSQKNESRSSHYFSLGSVIVSKAKGQDASCLFYQDSNVG